MNLLQDLLKYNSASSVLLLINPNNFLPPPLTHLLNSFLIVGSFRFFIYNKFCFLKNIKYI